MTTLADRLLPDQLWQRIQPLLPPPPSHARGGAPRTVPDRACMAAIIFLARPAKVPADKAYAHRRCRGYLSGRGIKVRIARCGIESSQRLGRHRWKAERSIA